MIIINDHSVQSNQVSEIGKGFLACEREEQLCEYLGNHLGHSDYESLWTEMIVTVGEILV